MTGHVRMQQRCGHLQSRKLSPDTDYVHNDLKLLRPVRSPRTSRNKFPLLKPTSLMVFCYDKLSKTKQGGKVQDFMKVYLFSSHTELIVRLGVKFYVGKILLQYFVGQCLIASTVTVKINDFLIFLLFMWKKLLCLYFSYQKFVEISFILLFDAQWCIFL